MQNIINANNGDRTNTSPARTAHPLPQLRPTGMRLSATAQAPAPVVHTLPRLSGHVGPRELRGEAMRVIASRRKRAEAELAFALDLLRRVEPLLRDATVRDSIEGRDHLDFVNEVNRRFAAESRMNNARQQKKATKRALQAVQISAAMYREVWMDLDHLEGLVQEIKAALLACEAELARVLADAAKLESGDMRAIVLLARSA